MFTRSKACLPRRGVANRLQFSLNACIIGAGPSGFYTAKYLLKKVETARVTIIERLPSPFGLARFGIAPDHAETKNCINDFTNVLNDERVTYYGNVDVGKDISLSEIRENFNAVVLSYGSASDKDFGLPGENGKNIFGARKFVNWYNGHPEYTDIGVDLSGKTAIILGQGNVAIDCGRILSSPIPKLEATDICTHATEALKSCNINKVHVVGRRGPVQGAFTNKELREIVSKLPGCQTVVKASDFEFNEETQKEIGGIQGMKRKMAIFDKAARSIDEKKKNIIFDFLLQPIEFLLDDNEKVCGVRFEKCELGGEPNNRTSIRTGEIVDIEAQLVLKSIGYKGLPLNESIPFDDRKGIVISSGGRVEAGLYCAGWIKRGPSGVIATNIPDAQETVNSIVADWSEGSLKEAKENPKLSLDSEFIVMKDDWAKLDEIEVSRGGEKKVREKLIDMQEIQELLSKSC